jgi:hypothetical protein
VSVSCSNITTENREAVHEISSRAQSGGPGIRHGISRITDGQHGSRCGQGRQLPGHKYGWGHGGCRRDRQFRAECYGFLGQHVPHQKQHGKCPRTFKNQHGVKLPVHKCVWLLRSTGWFGAGNIVHPKPIPHTPRKYCGEEPKGQIVMTSREKAVQWSSGWDLGTDLGIKGANLTASFNGSSQTGYDNNAQMVFTFKQAGVMCGTDHDPSRAALLVMRGHLP